MEIYQNIWYKDENKFSVSRRLSDGNFEKPTADILLDEQIKATENRGVDLTKNPLFNAIKKIILLFTMFNIMTIYCVKAQSWPQAG
jgi:hypothetical protein